MTSRIYEKIVEFNETEVLNEVKIRLKQGEDPLKIIDDCREGLIIVGEKYKAKEFFLAELLLSGEIFKAAMQLINPYLIQDNQKNIKGKVLLATIQGEHAFLYSFIIFISSSPPICPPLPSHNIINPAHVHS